MIVTKFVMVVSFLLIVEVVKKSTSVSLACRHKEPGPLALRLTDAEGGTSKSHKLGKQSPGGNLEILLNDFLNLFNDSLGCIKDITVSLKLDSDIQMHKFWSPRPVSFALEQCVALELDRLESHGIIEQNLNDISEYALPLSSLLNVLESCFGSSV